MVKFIESPGIIKAAGNKPKIIEEYFGRARSGTKEVSIARMISPEGWEYPGQCPEFNEYSLVLRGILKVKTRTMTHEVGEGQGILLEKGEWVQYSAPCTGGTEYISVCLPAFSPHTVHRDE